MFCKNILFQDKVILNNIQYVLLANYKDFIATYLKYYTVVKNSN